MTCKIAYTEKLLTKKNQNSQNAKIRIKKIVDKLCLQGYKKERTKPFIYSRNRPPVTRCCDIFIFIIYYIVCKAT